MRIVLFIALRQLWDRRFLNGIAVGGVTLGVVVLLGINGIMNGFQEKFYSSILKISPHVTILDKELRPAPSILSRFTDDFVAAAQVEPLTHERRVRKQAPFVVEHFLPPKHGELIRQRVDEEEFAFAGRNEKPRR